MVRRKKSKKNNDEHEWNVEQEWNVGKVIGKRIDINGRVEYLLQWEGWPEPTWEPESNLSCPKLIAEFEAHEAVRGTAPSEKSKTVTRKSKSSAKLAPFTRNTNRAIDTRASSTRQAEDTATSSVGLSSLTFTTERKRKTSVPSTKRSGRAAKTSNPRDLRDHRLEPMVGDEAPPSSSLRKRRKSDEFSKSMGSPWDRGLEPEEIQGANQEDGRLKFNMKWKNFAEPQMVLASEANVRCPQIVIDFYEKNLAWQPSSRKRW